MVVVAVGRDFTDVGHAAALGLGVLVSMRFGRPGNWTPVRFAMLGMAAGFGYLVLASTGLLVATAAALAGALAGEAIARWRVGSTQRDGPGAEQARPMDPSDAQTKLV